MDLLSKLNNTKDYCHLIKSGSYEQRVTCVPIKKVYQNINQLFMDRFDPTCSILDEKEKDVYSKQRLVEIATDIDEKRDTKYDNFNYNKSMKANTIQIGLQSPNQLSTLLYLSDIYNVTASIYIDKSQKKVVSSKKERNQFHILYRDGTFMELDDGLDFEEGSYEDLGECLVLNVKSIDIYNTHLQSIGKYKSPELIDIAKSLGIPLETNGKKKVKKQLYDDINLYYLNKP